MYYRGTTAKKCLDIRGDFGIIIYAVCQRKVNMQWYRRGHNEHDWKSCCRQKRHEGSNPSHCAILSDQSRCTHLKPLRNQGFQRFYALFFQSVIYRYTRAFQSVRQDLNQIPGWFGLLYGGLYALGCFFYCSSFLINLKLFIEEDGITFWYHPLFRLFWKYEHNPHVVFDSEYQSVSIWWRK